MIVSVAEEMNPCHRSTMEDCHVYYNPEAFSCGDPAISMLGVYDGHGGREIVEFLESRLGRNIAQELKYADNATIPERLERAFIITDVESRLEGIMNSGATVVVSLIRELPAKESQRPEERSYIIYTANCGDARAICSSPSSSYDKKDNKFSSVVKRLSVDHKATDSCEIRRIESSGGFVFRNRVLGVLAVSRSLGDHAFKKYVIGTPHIDESNVSVGKCGKGLINKEDNESFVLLACDGLWDVMDDDECAKFVKKSVYNSMDDSSNEKRKKEVAQLLVNEALKRGSTDNITALVAWL